MRFLLVGILACQGWAESPADQGYAALKRKDYDEAASAFRRALATGETSLAIRKELAYTLLKMGETEQGRDVFREIVQRAPNDTHAQLEYAFLCSETGDVGEARRAFDRLRASSDPVVKAAAEQAFQNLDKPLASAIDRGNHALVRNGNDFSSHLEVARAAEQRGDANRAAAHYLQAWRLKPSEIGLLVDLGRARKLAGDEAGAQGAWVAASRSPNVRASELAKDFLPTRYPYASEFQAALELDPNNTALRRELAFLWLAVDKPDEAIRELERLLQLAPADQVALAQLGMMLLDRGDASRAVPLLERALQGPDESLKQKVRTALAGKGKLKAARTEPAANTRELADRSYAAGYLQDAVRYYKSVLEQNPNDHEVNLRLGWALNTLKDDAQALRYFELARQSPDPKQSAEASRAYRNLRPNFARTRLTGWFLPMFSSRWHEGFGYGQLKADLRLGKLPFRPYLSVRMIGDSQRAASAMNPQYLSESAFIAGLGMATRPFKGIVAWAEAGSAIQYRKQPGIGRAIPDYRGGVSMARAWGPGRSLSEPGVFLETDADVVTLSRFGWDTLFVVQNRVGYTLPVLGLFSARAVWNINLTNDTQRQVWANFLDTGPGLRFRVRGMPPGMMWSIDWLRGAYWIRQGNPRKPNYYDVRAGVWYAFTR
ncbi:MAG: tetratricopeptide repeat protein [Bryobacterales bacterium]|nr:tetratricopeptide repeat protein [Bryobacterales bacterium]